MWLDLYMHTVLRKPSSRAAMLRRKAPVVKGEAD